MDNGSKYPSNLLGTSNNKIYMDLKQIIREHALQFLPAKSLFKFRGVCREWNHTITAPFFAHNQSLYFRSVSGLFFQTPGDLPTFLSLEPESCGIPDPSLKFLPEPIDIIASSNGLICCQSRTEDRAYYICNPTTKQWKKLPKPTMEHGHDPAIILVFKPSLLNFVPEYKLICAFHSIDFDDATEFEIYSSKDNTWKVSGEINFAAKKLIPKSGVCVNNVAYWQTFNGGILVFDLLKDRSQMMHGYIVNGTLGELNGKLCAASTNGRILALSVLSNIYSNTMEMGSNAKLWDNMVRINLTNEMLDVNSSDNFVALYVGGDAVLLLSGVNVYRFDLKTKEGKFVGQAPQVDNRKVYAMMNSLVTL